ncbi:hypothetical protein MMC09_006143 [Bachmanniomyces sp. S44760]|nr:hypothetical protein [Bachmanniomyces sp. S44760]
MDHSSDASSPEPQEKWSSPSFEGYRSDGECSSKQRSSISASSTQHEPCLATAPITRERAPEEESYALPAVESGITCGSQPTQGRHYQHLNPSLNVVQKRQVISFDDTSPPNLSPTKDNPASDTITNSAISPLLASLNLSSFNDSAYDSCKEASTPPKQRKGKATLTKNNVSLIVRPTGSRVLSEFPGGVPHGDTGLPPVTHSVSSPQTSTTHASANHEPLPFSSEPKGVRQIDNQLLDLMKKTLSIIEAVRQNILETAITTSISKTRSTKKTMKDENAGRDHVYVFRNPDSGLVKIGCLYHPSKKRHKAIRDKCGHQDLENMKVKLLCETCETTEKSQQRSLNISPELALRSVSRRKTWPMMNPYSSESGRLKRCWNDKVKDDASAKPYVDENEPADPHETRPKRWSEWLAGPSLRDQGTLNWNNQFSGKWALLRNFHTRRHETFCFGLVAEKVFGPLGPSLFWFSIYLIVVFLKDIWMFLNEIV